MFWAIVIAVIVTYLIWQSRDRKKHPAKWKAVDEEVKRWRAAKKASEYQKATARVPASQWMRMSKHEKADVLERREKAEKNRP